MGGTGRPAGGRAKSATGALGALVLAALLCGALAGPAAGKPSTASRYSIVKGCYALQPTNSSKWVAEDAGSYAATANRKGQAAPFRLQATDLGRYLFYGPAGEYLAVDGAGAVTAASSPSGKAVWIVKGRAGVFTATNETTTHALAVAPGGALVGASAPRAFRFAATDGCSRYPEVKVGVSGRPSRGPQRYGEVKGFVDGHMHQMAFEFLGGKAHCGRPWHPFGAPSALRDCPDHEVGNGCAAILENVLYGNPARCHDPVGWPTFKDWPHPESLTHESSYYRWLERSWRGGQRIFVNLLVENRVLCEVYPFRATGYNCNEMDSVRREAQRMYELQDYVDAQSGGPGKGWYRIVKNPFQARRVINRGKLAVIMGMEVSEPFGCRLVPVNQPAPGCNEASITAALDELRELGVRQLEITNKFDNALTGVAGDGGELGVVINGGQFMTSGGFWDLGPCEDPDNHDNSPGISATENETQDQIFAGLAALLPPLPLPIPFDQPACNQRGLSDLGEHAIREIAERHMVFDPDHMSVLGRNQALDLLEELDYSGVISSHSWSTPNAVPRIFKLGGVITPYGRDSTGFVHKWQEVRDARRGRQYFGLGWGADMNGFGSQGGPRGVDVPNPVVYPFKSFDGKQTIKQQVSGERVYDINADGVAHYGLFPDWVEDLRILSGDRIVRDLSRGAEAYLQMWERANGIKGVECKGWRERRLSLGGLGKALRLNASPRAALRKAGQPVRRTNVWRWCAAGRATVAASFDGRPRVELILSSLRAHQAQGVAPGDSAGTLRGKAREVAAGIWAGPRRGPSVFVYRVRGGRVSHVGVAKRSLLGNPGALAKAVNRAAR